MLKAKARIYGTKNLECDNNDHNIEISNGRRS